MKQRRRTMTKPYKILLETLVFLSLIGITVFQVKAQGNQIESEILPSQGTANTIILIRFRTVNASVGNVQKADIFWDNYTIALNQEGVQGADGSYNYNLTVPTEPPLSERGNHTIRVDSSVFNYGQVTFNFTFNITEFVPSTEYLALNATYYSLLDNYTNLLDNYTQLLANYNNMSTDYATLLTEHNQLLLNYNSLSANYNSLIANYNSLSANYNSMLTNYDNLHLTFGSQLTNYTSLQGNFESLSSNYNILIEDYNSLNSSYTGLESNYEAARGQLAFSTNLNYILIISTIVLAVISVYFIILKPKTTSRTR
jgi:hypothetical protein